MPPRGAADARRGQLAVYGAGMFANSMGQLANVVLPLWVLTFDPSALLVGVVLGSRHALPLALSIHGGALMDRLGTRRVMIGFAFLGAAIPLLFPLLPWIPATIALQALAGLAVSMGWMGAQTMIGQVMQGSAVHAGRLTFSLRFGHLAGPPLVGAAWDLFGPWGAFAAMSLWGWCGFAAVLMLPVAPAERAARGAAGGRVRLRDLVPRLADYVETVRMISVPAIALVLLVTMLRNAGNGIQSSFYVVYLEQFGLSGTLIGTLLAAAAVVGGAGALSVGALLRLFDAHRLLLATVAASIALVAITPLLGSFALLLAAAGLRGASMGVSQPLMISVLARAAGAEAQGRSVGLRNTANRLTGLIVPVLMGAAVEAAGLANAFYIVGGTTIALLAVTALWAVRSPALAAARDDGAARSAPR